MKKMLWAVLGAVCLLSGCSWVHQVEIQQVSLQKLKMEVGRGVYVELAAEVNNPTARTIRLTSLEGRLAGKDNVLATVRLADTVAVDPHTRVTVPVPLEVSFSDPLLLLKMGLQLSEEDLAGFRADGKAVAEAGRNGRWIRRTFRIKDRPLEELLRRFR